MVPEQSSIVILQSLNFLFVEDSASVNDCFRRLGVATSVTEEKKDQEIIFHYYHVVILYRVT
ncbi:MAG: hypothetical protein BA866_00080 [Desulfobulbaceae bacterium S5133MH15]|nr:MAG: hypothetical protein BA866_00080 [Desulfobulbaceae bacterium S5133MH15]OEU84464.1 MAG: hypothetical protein BA873_03155 [Desulfobulbaceae bacterium C00003063]